MRLLRLAVKEQRWDLAAHTIVLAAARILNREEPDAGRNRQKKGRVPPKTRPDRLLRRLPYQITTGEPIEPVAPLIGVGV